jgi:hypothetical protein
MVRPNCFSGATTPSGQNLLAGGLLVVVLRKTHVFPSAPVLFDIPIPPDLCSTALCVQALIRPVSVFSSPVGPPSGAAPVLTNAIAGVTGF